jgi:hypothetical protein
MLILTPPQHVFILFPHIWRVDKPLTWTSLPLHLVSIDASYQDCNSIDELS